MGSVKVQDYVVYEEHKIMITFHDVITLPPMTFVKPVELCYVPKHVQERWKDKFDPKKDVFCYCRLGFLPIPRSVIKER